MSDYRYQLEKYRGRGTRHVCPQCHRKGVFTRYVDTYNNNIYISDNVGKCDRLDKCGYHYTPKQYYTDNPWKSDVVRSFANIGKTNERTKPPRPIDTIPEWIFERSRSNGMPRSVQDHVIARLGTSRGNLKERIKEFKEIKEIREFKEIKEIREFKEIKELKEFKENNVCAILKFPKFPNVRALSALSLRFVRCPRRYAPRHDVRVSANESPPVIARRALPDVAISKRELRSLRNLRNLRRIMIAPSLTSLTSLMSALSLRLP